MIDPFQCTGVNLLHPVDPTPTSPKARRTRPDPPALERHVTQLLLLPQVVHVADDPARTLQVRVEHAGVLA